MIIAKEVFMEYVINCFYDSDANVWFAENDYIPLTMESASLDNLMSRVRHAVPDQHSFSDEPRDTQ